MYHRYLRNDQGEYRRQTIPDPPRQNRISSPAPSLPPPQAAPTAAAGKGPPPAPPQQAPDPELPRRREEADRAPAPEYGIPFLNKLFPNMDQGDLLLLLIMVLLLSEGNEDASSMAMTLAIFLFLQ